MVDAQLSFASCGRNVLQASRRFRSECNLVTTFFGKWMCRRISCCPAASFTFPEPRNFCPIFASSRTRHGAANPNGRKAQSRESGGWIFILTASASAESTAPRRTPRIAYNQATNERRHSPSTKEHTSELQSLRQLV